PRALVELDDRNGVGGREAGCGRAVVDDIAVELALAARLEHRDLARGAGRAERPRREIDMGAGIAALQAQLARPRAVPEMLGLRCRFWFRARWLGHIVSSLPISSNLDATFDQSPSTVHPRHAHGPYSATRTMDEAGALVSLKSRA